MEFSFSLKIKLLQKILKLIIKQTKSIMSWKISILDKLNLFFSLTKTSIEKEVMHL